MSDQFANEHMVLDTVLNDIDDILLQNIPNNPMTSTNHQLNELIGAQQFYRQQAMNMMNMATMPTMHPYQVNHLHQPSILNNGNMVHRVVKNTDHHHHHGKLDEIERVINEQYIIAQETHHMFTNKGYKSQHYVIPNDQSQSASPSSSQPSVIPSYGGRSHLQPSSATVSPSPSETDGAQCTFDDDAKSANKEQDEQQHIAAPSSSPPSTNTLEIEPFCVESGKLQFKDFVFISKDCTSRLSDYIVQENWGKDNGLLYKYLDYIFRCQTYSKKAIVINGKYLIFHSGLQRRSDKQPLFCLLIPNKRYVSQRWRVQYGKIGNAFLSKSELLSRLPQSYLVADDLPTPTKFYSTLSELLYDDSYSIQVNWEERLSTNKDRICRVIGSDAFFDNNFKFMRLTELVAAFDAALEHSKQIASLNPRLAVAQGFIDSKNEKYRIELLLPLIVEFPAGTGQRFMFALALSKCSEMEQQYVVKSVLTMEMAYANARLVGYVDSCWLSMDYSSRSIRSNNLFFFNHK